MAKHKMYHTKTHNHKPRVHHFKAAKSISPSIRNTVTSTPKGTTRTSSIKVANERIAHSRRSDGLEYTTRTIDHGDRVERHKNIVYNPNKKPDDYGYYNPDDSSRISTESKEFVGSALLFSSLAVLFLTVIGSLLF